MLQRAIYPANAPQAELVNLIVVRPRAESTKPDDSRGIVITFGSKVVSQSINPAHKIEAQKKHHVSVSTLNPKRQPRKENIKAQQHSTIGWRIEILVLHEGHLPCNQRKLSTGIFSYQRML